LVRARSRVGRRAEKSGSEGPVVGEVGEDGAEAGWEERRMAARVARMVDSVERMCIVEHAGWMVSLVSSNPF
jgi:hypothetical protein